MRRWLGALLAPADDPRPRQAMAEHGAPDTDALLADLQRSRDELAALRGQLERAASGMAEGQRERIAQQVRELAAEEAQLLLAEQNLRLSIDERHAQRVLEQARLRALEAELRLDD